MLMMLVLMLMLMILGRGRRGFIGRISLRDWIIAISSGRIGDYRRRRLFISIRTRIRF